MSETISNQEARKAYPVLYFIKMMRAPSLIPRRQAYLFTWGMGYSILAIAWLILDSWWGIFFFAAGFCSILAAIYMGPRLTALAFSLLSGTAAIHALSFFVNIIAVSLPMQMSVMWVVVAMAHVIVAGWPSQFLATEATYGSSIYESDHLAETIKQIEEKMRHLESLHEHD